MTTQAEKQTEKKAMYKECGICGHFHPLDFDGDCRDDETRFTAEAIDSVHGVGNWDFLTFERDAILFLDGNRGVYIPQQFAQMIDRNCVHADTGDNRLEMALDYLIKEGIDGEFYWDEWTYILDNALVTNPENGIMYRLHQDGDLWLLPEGVEIPEI